MSSTQRWIAVGAATAGLLALAACTPSNKSGGTGGNAGSGGSSGSAGPSDTLTLAVDTPPDDWNPADASPADPNLLYYQAPYDFLINTDSTGKLVPGLATNWVSTPKSLTLTLRSGVTFTDGTPFDATAVKVNVENQQKNGLPPNKGVFANVTGIDVVSPTEVRLDLAKPTPQLPNNLARQQGLMASPKAIQSNPEGLKTNPVGTGGWFLDTKATVPNSKYVFHENPNYWNKSAVGFKNVVIEYIPDDQARTNALLTHQVDWINYGAQFESQIKAAGFSTLQTPEFPYYLEILDRNGTMIPALKNPLVRQAMAYALDRATFVKVTLAGQGTPTTQWTIPGQLGYDASYTGMAYDLAKAKSLMQQAGVSGFTVTVPSYGPFDAYNEAIAGFLARIGITVKLQTVQTGNVSGAAASGKYAMAIVPSHAVHPQDFYRTYVSTHGSQNPFGIAAPDVDALMSKISGDAAADAPIYEQMSKTVSDDAFVIPVAVINAGSGWDGNKLTGVSGWLWTEDVRLTDLRGK